MAVAKPDKVNKYEEVTRKYGDPWIWGIYFTLIIISIIESYSASSREVAKAGVYMPIIKHCIFLAVGFACVFFLYRSNYNNKNLLALMIPGLGVFTIISLVYVMLFGEVINGAQRAISLPGGFTLQPAELAKLSIVTLLAYILARSQKNKDVTTGGIIGAAFIVAVFGGLLLQSGLTNTLLLMCISICQPLLGNPLSAIETPGEEQSHTGHVNHKSADFTADVKESCAPGNDVPHEMEFPGQGKHVAEVHYPICKVGDRARGTAQDETAGDKENHA